MDYEAEDKAALRTALIALRTCPKCRRALRPCWDGSCAVGCVSCDEVFEISPEALAAARTAHCESGDE